MNHNRTEKQQGGTGSSKLISVEHRNDPVFMIGSPGYERASSGGHGTLEILEVTQLLNGAGITCCIVGISALKYYGAGRVRCDWELCVPTERLSEASTFLVSNDTYEAYPPRPLYRCSLLHTFPRFKVRDKALCFTLIPSDDAHIDCIPSNIEHSQTGLPYPTLPIFAQSLLDTNDMVALTDLIDGMDLTEQWGSDFMKLDAKNDLAWILRKNEKIQASVPFSENSCLLELPINSISLKEAWCAIVQSKERRIGLEYPEGYWATRFRLRGSVDPRSTERHYV